MDKRRGSRLLRDTVILAFTQGATMSQVIETFLIDYETAHDIRELMMIPADRCRRRSYLKETA